MGYYCGMVGTVTQTDVDVGILLGDVFGNIFALLKLVYFQFCKGMDFVGVELWKN